jgi:uncharacterized protein (TIGR02145 family)
MKNPVNPFILAIGVLTFLSCTEIQRNNPLDPDGINFIGYSSSSSSEATPSSSSGASSSSAHSSSSAAALLPCGIGTYDPSIQFCFNGNTPTELCGGKQYDDYQFCTGDEVYDKCDGKTYDIKGNICCSNVWVAIEKYRCCFHEKYEFETHFCYDKKIKDKCGGSEYDPATQFCHTDGITYSCDNRPYDPAKYFCTKSEAHPEIVLLCEDKGYDTKHKFCHENTIYDKCGTETYNPISQFCHTDGIVYNKCDGYEYDPETEQCCGSSRYDPETHFCTKSEAHPEVVELCGGKGYDTKKKMCHFDMAKDFFIDTRDGEVYPYVKIGTQTWMAKNLNFNASGSKCYAEGVNDVSADSIAKNCNTYGRLYDWATAMGFLSKCNTTSSTSNSDCAIKTPHQGICPEGWHIPSTSEWDELLCYVDGSTGTSSHNSLTAGKYLKTKSGWNDYHEESGNGEDKFGFSALPDGSGNNGYWWSSIDNGNNAYNRGMFYSNEYVLHGDFGKYNSYSVRCVKDDD